MAWTNVRGPFTRYFRLENCGSQFTIWISWTRTGKIYMARCVFFCLFFYDFLLRRYSEMFGVDEWSDLLFLITYNFMLVWVIILIRFYMFSYELFT